MTHDDLEKIGAYWLLKAGYHIIDFETKRILPRMGFIPDILGIKLPESVGNMIPNSSKYLMTVIEVKTSRSDWRSKSQKKKENFSKNGFYANLHYILCPSGMLKSNEIHPLWGLIIIGKDGIPRIQKRARKVKDVRKITFWEILQAYAKSGMYYRMKEIGLDYYGRYVITGSKLDKLLHPAERG